MIITLHLLDAILLVIAGILTGTSTTLLYTIYSISKHNHNPNTQWYNTQYDLTITFIATTIGTTFLIAAVYLDNIYNHM